VGIRKKHFLFNKNTTTEISIIQLTPEQEATVKRQDEDEAALVAATLEDAHANELASPHATNFVERDLAAARERQRSAAHHLRSANAHVKTASAQLRMANAEVQGLVASLFSAYHDEGRDHESLVAVDAAVRLKKMTEPPPQAEPAYVQSAPDDVKVQLGGVGSRRADVTASAEPPQAEQQRSPNLRPSQADDGLDDAALSLSTGRLVMV
jgi:hypothetical protein